MKKLMSLILVIMVCAMPLAGIAEQAYLGKLYTLTLGNVTFSAPGIPEHHIDAALALKMGATEEGRALFDMSATGGDATIAHMMIAGNEQSAKAYLEGMSSAYAVTKSEMDQIAAQMEKEMGASAAMPSGMDSQALQGMIEGYIGLIADMNDPAKLEAMQSEELALKIMELFGVDPEAATASEEVTVMGQKMTLPRFDLTFDMKNVDALYDLLASANDNYNKFWTNYKKFFATALGMNPETFSLSDLFATTGSDMTMDMTIWTDQEYVLADVKMNMSVTVDGETQTQVVPYTIEGRETENELDMVMKMDLSEQGAAMDVTVKANKTDAGKTMKVDAVMDVDGDKVNMNIDFALNTADPKAKSLTAVYTIDASGQVVTMKIDGSLTKDDKGTKTLTGSFAVNGMGDDIVVSLNGSSSRLDGAEAITGTLAVNYNGQDMGKATLSYEGTYEKTGDVSQREGRVNFDASVMGETIKVGFDLGLKKEPLTEAAFAQIDQLPSVSFTQLMQDPTAQQNAMLELETVGITAMGALMQTPGIAELLAQAMSPSGGYDSYGYGDYGYDGQPQTKPSGSVAA